MHTHHPEIDDYFNNRYLAEHFAEKHLRNEPQVALIMQTSDEDVFWSQTG